MTHFSLLFVLMILPLIGCLFICFVRGNENFVRLNTVHIGVLISGCTIATAVQFRYALNNLIEDTSKFTLMFAKSLGVGISLGMDGLSFIFVMLATFSFLICVLLRKKRVLIHFREQMFLVLLSEFFLILTLCARDLFLFYISYESMLISTFALCVCSEKEEQINAVRINCLYSIAGSGMLLLALLMLYNISGNSSFEYINLENIPKDYQYIILTLLLLSIALKIVLPIIHDWLLYKEYNDKTIPLTDRIIEALYVRIPVYVVFRILLPSMNVDKNKFILILVLSLILSAPKICYQLVNRGYQNLLEALKEKEA
ncbi:MAG: hypothetical protein MJ247_04165 [Alphaproteobacteria bacterium]|nr:hypothetical protein [Alphaproteobacteria bacterium]